MKRKIYNKYVGYEKEDENDIQDSDHAVGDFVNHNRSRGMYKK